MSEDTPTPTAATPETHHPTQPDTPTSETLKTPWVVETILKLQHNTKTAAALKKAGSPATAHYALPYLSHLWTDAPWKKTPTLTLAYLITTTKTHHDATTHGGIGTTAARLKRKGYDNVELRMMRNQTQKLEHITTDLAYLFSTATKNNIPTNWAQVWYTIQNWNHPNKKIRTETRQKVLEEYYQTLYLESKKASQPAETT